MELPRDGVPRISTEGIRLLEQGLAGDFGGWETVPYLNHPHVLPDRCLSNVVVRADDRGHFTAMVWFGPSYPTVKGMRVAPVVVFDRMDLKEAYSPPSPTIDLIGGDRWNRVVLLKDDELAFKGAVGEDDAGEEEGCPCDEPKPDEGTARAPRPLFRTLEDWT